MAGTKSLAGAFVRSAAIVATVASLALGGFAATTLLDGGGDEPGGRRRPGRRGRRPAPQHEGVTASGAARLPVAAPARPRPW